VSSPVVRRLCEGDVLEAVAVWERSRWDAQPWLEERMGHSHDDNLGYFRDVICRENAVWLAVLEERVVGMMALGGGRIDQLYVDPASQGRGVGTRLLEEAKALSPGGVTLFTHQRNRRARDFYEQRGFRVVAFGVSPAPESEPDVEYLWQPGH